MHYIILVAMIIMVNNAHAATTFPTGLTWDWNINGAVSPSDMNEADVYDVDLFDNDAATIAALKEGGKRVICYFSGGSYEEWRDDADQFQDGDLGAKLDGWPGENWLDHRSDNVRKIMAARLDVAKEKGCDAVEPDNMDGYANNNGVGLSADDQLDYNRYIAEEAHKRDLAVGLKNDAEQAAELEPYFDFVVIESCHVYNECDAYQAFQAAGKALFSAEYDVDNFDQMCETAVRYGLHSVHFALALDGSLYRPCPAPESQGITPQAAPTPQTNAKKQCYCRKTD